MKMLILLFGLLVLGAAGITQSNLTENVLTLDEGAASPPAGIWDMAWLAGQWKGEGLGGAAEENWLPPAGGAMAGVFRLLQNGSVGFYEIVAIEEVDSSLVCKVKHFNPDLTGWEEKNEYVTFPLVRMGRRQVWFDGLTMRREGDSLHTFVAISNREGEVREGRFDFKLVKAGERTLQETAVAYLHAANRAEALSFLADDLRLYFGEKTGDGLTRDQLAQNLTWDFALHPHSAIHGLERDGNRVTLHLTETNDFARLIGFPGWRAALEVTFDAEGQISELFIKPDPVQESYTQWLAPALEWLRAHHPDELAAIYPDGRLIYSDTAAREWVRLLKLWKASR